MERRAVNPWSWQDEFGFSQAVEVRSTERTLYCAGQTSGDADGNVLHPGDMMRQIRTAMENLERVLTDADFGLEDVVRLNVYTMDVDTTIEHWGEIVGPLAEAGNRPAMTLLGVARLAFPEMMVEIEATAVR